MELENFRQIWWKTSSPEEFIEWFENKERDTCELDKISKKYNCDKSSSQIVSKKYNNGINNDDLVVPGHNYTEIYNQIFESIRFDNLKILELGVGNRPTNGYSMRMWMDFFINANFSFLDWRQENFIFDFPYDEKRVNFWVCDQSNIKELNDFANQNINKFNIIIDDCSHIAEHQINTLKILFDKTLNENGFYIIEDIHENEFLKFIPELFDNLNRGCVIYENLYDDSIKNISSITFYRGMVIIKKGKKITR